MLIIKSANIVEADIWNKMKGVFNVPESGQQRMLLNSEINLLTTAINALSECKHPSANAVAKNIVQQLNHIRQQLNQQLSEIK